MSQRRASAITGARRRSCAARGIRYCIGAYVDIHGNPKAKCVPIDHFEHMMEGSELFTGYALDGLGQAPNDDEISADARPRAH